MAKYISLFGGTTTDTTVQVAKENQIIIGYGPYSAMNRYVVYKVEHTDDGYMYHLLNLETKKTDRTDILQPLSRKHGIGRYYDDVNPQFMDPFEVALLVEEAEKQAAAEARQAEPREEYEHREKYSMGAGYYLGQSKYYGWIIKKMPIYNRERTIEDFAYTAGDEANIRLSNATAERLDKRPETVVQGDFVIVDYSDKAVAVFGDTKPIKTELSALGGRFNSRLTYEGQKKAGWIFQKAKEAQVRRLIDGMNE